MPDDHQSGTSINYQFQGDKQRVIPIGNEGQPVEVTAVTKESQGRYCLAVKPTLIAQ